MDLYYEVNFLSLVTSLLAVFASVYIKFSLNKTLIFKKTQYRRFIIAGMVVLGLFFAILFHFLTSILSFVRLDISKWLEGLFLLAQMTSDNITLNVIEALCTFFLLIGIMMMVHLSNEIESIVKRLDVLRQEDLEKS